MSNSQTPSTFLTFMFYMQFKDRVSIHKFLDALRNEMRNAPSHTSTTSQEGELGWIQLVTSFVDKAYMQASIKENARASHFAYKHAKFRDNAQGYNYAHVGLDQTQPILCPLAMTVPLNAFEGAEVSGNARLFNGCNVYKSAIPQF